MASFDKIVVVTRKTRLEGLIDRFNTRGQAKFYIEHAGGDFADYEREDDAYRRSLEALRRRLDLGLKVHCRRSGARPDVPVHADRPGRRGRAGRPGRQRRKYVGRAADRRGESRPGAVRRHAAAVSTARREARAVARVLEGTARYAWSHAGRGALDDGQRLLGVQRPVHRREDPYVGPLSDRVWATGAEAHSSSGVLVRPAPDPPAGSPRCSTWRPASPRSAGGAGGRRSLVVGGSTSGLCRARAVYQQPFRGVDRGGLDRRRQEVALESLMPSGGVIFSDGVEADALEFNTGAVGFGANRATASLCSWHHGANVGREDQPPGGRGPGIALRDW